jgi:hypothetical protein
VWSLLDAEIAERVIRPAQAACGGLAWTRQFSISGCPRCGCRPSPKRRPFALFARLARCAAEFGRTGSSGTAARCRARLRFAPGVRHLRRRPGAARRAAFAASANHLGSSITWRYRRRARCVPDRAVNLGASRSLADSPAWPPTCGRQITALLPTIFSAAGRGSESCRARQADQNRTSRRR